MKLFHSFYIALAICLFSLGSCSLFRAKCKIEKCHILKTHTHPHVFDAKEFRGEKKRLRQLKRKKKKASSDTTAIVSDSLAITSPVIDPSDSTNGNNQPVVEEKKLSKKEQKKLDKKLENEKDDLGPDEGKEETKQDDGPGWEDELWDNGNLVEDGQEEETEEEQVNEEELIDAEEEDLDSKKELKKELKASEKSRKSEEKSSAKQARQAKKVEKKINREWRSNVTPWWRWNQKPKIGEKWKRSKKK